jgi:LTXXQ motif family protein
MTRNKKLAIGGLTLLAIVGGVAAASAGRHGGWGHGGHHRMGGGMGGLMGMACKGNASERADLMLVKLEYGVKPTDAQKPAFEELKTAARAAASKAASACPPKPERAADGTPPARPSPPERLARMEAGLVAQLDAVRTVKPAVDKFYATLSDEQKKLVADMGGRHRGGMGHGGREGRGEWHRGEGRGERGEGRGDRGPAGTEPVPDRK